MKHFGKKVLKSLLGPFGIEISRNHSKIYETKVVPLTSQNSHKGNALISYLIKPFLHENPGEPGNASDIFECFQIAQTFLDLGYSVDVINFHNRSFVPQKEYSFFVDIESNLERIAPLLNPDCVKILYPIMAHWVYNNYAAHRRSFELQKRRGVAIQGRTTSQSRSIEYADCAVIKANEFSLGTYRFANKPLYRVPQMSPSVYAWPEAKDFEACRKNFLWLSGSGFVHKGLDLALEVFAEMPDHHLYVCGRLEKEMDQDFQKAYSKELFETPNIHTIGSMDVQSSEFNRLAKTCVAHLHLSCSECGAVSVITCMHAGLIPIVTYESSVDVGDFGVLLNDCSPETVKSAVQETSDLDPETLRRKSREAWEYARANHTYEKYTKALRGVLTVLVQEYEKRKAGVAPLETHSSPRR